MLSRDKLSGFLLFSGLLIAVFLGFETLSGFGLRIIGTISSDSTYIVALVDAIILFAGMIIHPDNRPQNSADPEVRPKMSFLQVGLVFFTLFLSGLLITSTIFAISWQGVYWFDPSLNFQLIRSSFQSNLFVSLMLVFVLVLMLSGEAFEPDKRGDANK